MGARKRLMSKRNKEIKKENISVKLSSCPLSPRKMRLVTALILHKPVFEALHILRNSSKNSSVNLEKLLLSSMDSYKNKTGLDVDDSVYIKQLRVDVAGFVKRIKPAPQGRAHRIRKRSNHVVLTLDSTKLIKNK